MHPFRKMQEGMDYDKSIRLMCENITHGNFSEELARKNWVIENEKLKAYSWIWFFCWAYSGQDSVKDRSPENVMNNPNDHADVIRTVWNEIFIKQYEDVANPEKMREIYIKSQDWVKKYRDKPQNVKNELEDELDTLLSEIEKNKETNMDEYINLLNKNKNLILTGAPGTGKTFLAKQIAMQMIGINDEEELEKSEQFNFVQFHPSYDYTDFVEGLRPITNGESENKNIGFKIKSGIFKNFCKRAASTVNEIDNFSESWDKFLRIFEIEKFLNIPGPDEGYMFRIEKAKNDSSVFHFESNFYYKDGKDNEYKWDHTKTFFKNDLNNVYRGNPLELDYKYNGAIIEFMEKNCELKKFKARDITNTNKKYIFVIDEINRGEVSKIFGELFFSIDPGYRGTKGKVKTQYANLQNNNDDFGGWFYVPENVYIIGTMNDIDRSVESFDFAMRRRFIWKEVTAKESADNMKLPDNTKKVMQRLNEAISEIEGLNQSYHIGASYFREEKDNEIIEPDYNKLWNFQLELLFREYLRGTQDIDKNIKRLHDAYLGKESDNQE